jgi:hypothetical protein
VSRTVDRLRAIFLTLDPKARDDLRLVLIREQADRDAISELYGWPQTFLKAGGGLEERQGLDWILFFGTDQREVQLSVMKLDIKAKVAPRHHDRG